jgi:ATP-binding cassette subfamily C protein LapB
MNELFRRLFRSKPLAVEIIVASLFVNILFLASPIYVIQILSRYIGYGFDGTLYTLTAGMLIALVLGLAFTFIRTRMCGALSCEPDRFLQEGVLDALASVKTAALERIPQARLQEIMAAPQIVQAAYEASRIASVLDMPFFLLFFLAVFFLSPLLALVTLLAVVMSVMAGTMSMNSTRKADGKLRQEAGRHRGSVGSAIQSSETVRAYGGRPFLRRIWEEQVASVSALRERIVDKKSWSLAAVQGLSSLLKVSIYAVGAKQVVMGDLTVGALIGVSILSTKALQISSSFMQTVQLLGRADEATRMINEFVSLPRESTTGTALKEYSGRIELKDVAMAFPGSTGPLFESLTCTIMPGGVVGVLGNNGAGKSTLSKLVAGLLEPVRGQILVDGVELRQLSSEWWRKQVMYLPQEPSFLNGTYRDNIKMPNPDIESEALNSIIREADLRRFLDAGTQGLETRITDGGRSLPLGIRKRLALARALVSNGQLAVFDEPTEGLDTEGCEAVIAVMNRLIEDGVTIIVVSRDPNIMKSFNAVIDLNSKPVPKVGVVQKKPADDGQLRKA